MNKEDKERVYVFKRILQQNDSPIAFELLQKKESELLKILNYSVLPNSLSFNVLKYTYWFNFFFVKNKQESDRKKKFLKKIDLALKNLDYNEKDMIKYGFFYGFKSANPELEMQEFVKFSSDPEKGELIFKKRISLFSFKRFFNFVHSLITKGEKNERFPRIG